ncbi:hypothetical protein TREMTM_C_00200 [Candidatus Tremblaya princeps]|uniref:Uncharacterized protein n=1 Tax=Tremblaya princeps TaxID=189385 RepID=A0A1C3K8Y6_TREPR|nr:hypothetical protein TREMTM_C_00200 [Candidatus Tremblaya princeps]
MLADMEQAMAHRNPLARCCEVVPQYALAPGASPLRRSAGLHGPGLRVRLALLGIAFD